MIDQQYTFYSDVEVFEICIVYIVTCNVTDVMCYNIFAPIAETENIALLIKMVPLAQWAD